MDAKDLRIEHISEHSDDGRTKYAHNTNVLQCDQNKPYQDNGSNSLSKVDVPTARPCAVIGPDRIVPPITNDAYLKKQEAEPWSGLDGYYRPPEYPHKISDCQNPTRNISPRQTFQENMQRIMVPPRYNAVKLNEDPNFAIDRNINQSKFHKLNIPPDGKYCEVPYVNPVTNEQKSVRNIDPCVTNPALIRGGGWPAGSANVRPSRSYGAPELYQYQDYANCPGPKPMPVNRAHRTVHDENGHIYPDPYYHAGNIHFKPYAVKERYPQARYDYVTNYANPYHQPPHKYDLQKSISHHPYPAHPQVPLKYLENRLSEPVIDGYQRPNQQQNYNIHLRNQVIHPSYGSVPGNSLQSKAYPYPSDSSVKSAASNKLQYEHNKMYVDYDVRNRPYHVPENFFPNEMTRYPIKGSMPSYPPINVHSLSSHPYYRKDIKSYDHYPHTKNIDGSIHNNLPRHPSQYSPTAVAISPSDSNTSNDTIHTQGTSQEDCGYVSQSSTASIRSMDSLNRIHNDFYRRYDYRYGPLVKTSPLYTKPEMNFNNNHSKEKKDIDVRQFLQMWNEGEEEAAENINKEIVIQTLSNTTKQNEVNNQEQLYVLGLVNVPNEELGKYEHIQKVSKLPENIKGYNNIELLNQFEEAIESSNMSKFNMKPLKSREVHSTLKNTLSSQRHDIITRPLSPLDVEAKISQSIIHKEVGCNFQIKPCSPKMLNVEVAASVQNMNERIIEKVANPLISKPPIVMNAADEKQINLNLTKNQDRAFFNENVKVPSCKMINTQFLTSDSTELVKTNYSFQDLESSSGVCLASLPRLDNDIELNFPEVNQQFINANKIDSTVQTAYQKQLLTLDIDRTDVKGNLGSQSSETSNNLSSNVESEKEVVKLSKYRKNKTCSLDSKINYQTASVQALRTDSVIIKNPENKHVEENLINSPFVSSQEDETQHNPINLTMQVDPKNFGNHDIDVLKYAEDKDASSSAIDFSVNSSLDDGEETKTKSISDLLFNDENSLVDPLVKEGIKLQKNTKECLKSEEQVQINLTKPMNSVDNILTNNISVIPVQSAVANLSNDVTNNPTSEHIAEKKLISYNSTEKTNTVNLNITCSTDNIKKEVAENCDKGSSEISHFNEFTNKNNIQEKYSKREVKVIKMKKRFENRANKKHKVSKSQFRLIKQQKDNGNQEHKYKMEIKKTNMYNICDISSQPSTSGVDIDLKTARETGIECNSFNIPSGDILKNNINSHEIHSENLQITNNNQFFLDQTLQLIENVARNEDINLKKNSTIISNDVFQKDVLTDQLPNMDSCALSTVNISKPSNYKKVFKNETHTFLEPQSAVKDTLYICGPAPTVTDTENVDTNEHNKKNCVKFEKYLTDCLPKSALLPETDTVTQSKNVVQDEKHKNFQPEVCHGNILDANPACKDVYHTETSIDFKPQDSLQNSLANSDLEPAKTTKVAPDALPSVDAKSNNPMLNNAHMISIEKCNNKSQDLMNSTNCNLVQNEISVSRTSKECLINDHDFNSTLVNSNTSNANSDTFDGEQIVNPRCLNNFQATFTAQQSSDVETDKDNIIKASEEEKNLKFKHKKCLWRNQSASKVITIASDESNIDSNNENTGDLNIGSCLDIKAQEFLEEIPNSVFRHTEVQVRSPAEVTIRSNNTLSKNIDELIQTKSSSNMKCQEYTQDQDISEAIPMLDPIVNIDTSNKNTDMPQAKRCKSPNIENEHLCDKVNYITKHRSHDISKELVKTDCSNTEDIVNEKIDITQKISANLDSQEYSIQDRNLTKPVPTVDPVITVFNFIESSNTIRMEKCEHSNSEYENVGKGEKLQENYVPPHIEQSVVNDRSKEPVQLISSSSDFTTETFSKYTATISITPKVDIVDKTIDAIETTRSKDRLGKNELGNYVEKRFEYEISKEPFKIKKCSYVSDDNTPPTSKNIDIIQNEVLDGFKSQDYSMTGQDLVMNIHDSEKLDAFPGKKCKTLENKYLNSDESLQANSITKHSKLYIDDGLFETTKCSNILESTHESSPVGLAPNLDVRTDILSYQHSLRDENCKEKVLIVSTPCYIKKELFSPWIQKLILFTEGSDLGSNNRQPFIDKLEEITENEKEICIQGDQINIPQLIILESKNTVRNILKDNIDNKMSLITGSCYKENANDLSFGLSKGFASNVTKDKDNLVSVKVTQVKSLKEIATEVLVATPYLKKNYNLECRHKICDKSDFNNEEKMYELTPNLNEENTIHNENSLITDKLNDGPLEKECSVINNPYSRRNVISSRKKASLKRSLSDTDLNLYNECYDDSKQNGPENVWAKKRKKICAHENLLNPQILHENICKMMQNNRRNSVSAVYNEENISFCILIDDNCIITEENDETQKICFAEMLEEVVESCNHINEDVNANPMKIVPCREDNFENSDSVTFDCAEDKQFNEAWVEDVACVETIVSDDIAEDITISMPSSPRNCDVTDDSGTEESDIFNSDINEHTEKVKYIYGDKMRSDDAKLVEKLFRTPQMDMNKTLVDIETHITEGEKYYDKDSLERILSGSNSQDVSECYVTAFNSSDTYSLNNEIGNNDKNLSVIPCTDIPNDNMLKLIDNNTLFSQNDDYENHKVPKPKMDSLNPHRESTYSETVHKNYEQTTQYTRSPEVSSTTSEEKNPNLFFSINTCRNPNISHTDDVDSIKEKSSCELKEDKNYMYTIYHNSEVPKVRPLITKGAQKYIPPLKETIPDLKVKLPLPHTSLIKLKKLKTCKGESKPLLKLTLNTNTSSAIKKETSKKLKPKFEDVLKSIDEIQIKMHKEKHKKIRKYVPKVVIKKNENGSHYASTSKSDTHNPDLTGRKWQPWVFLEKNYFLDKMVLKKKTTAIYNHKKKTYVLAENLPKYRAANSAKFIISQSHSENPCNGPLKCTIRLKHS